MEFRKLDARPDPALDTEGRSARTRRVARPRAPRRAAALAARADRGVGRVEDACPDRHGESRCGIPRLALPSPDRTGSSPAHHGGRSRIPCVAADMRSRKFDRISLRIEDREKHSSPKILKPRHKWNNPPETEQNAIVYTDEASHYKAFKKDRRHKAVNHSAGQYVDGDTHTNGMEAHWSVVKRAQIGVYHKISPKHLGRYATELEARHNIRESDTIDQMAWTVRGGVGKRLKYADLIADNGKDNGRGPDRIGGCYKGGRHGDCTASCDKNVALKVKVAVTIALVDDAIIHPRY